jgi:hypothetical protein
MVMPRSIPPPGSDGSNGVEAEETGSRVMRFGTAASAVVLASILATMPAAVRVAPQVAASCSAASAWVSLLALAFVPLLVTTVVLRHALAALRLFDSKAVAGGVAVAIVWALLTFTALTPFGAALRATTHHHGLAGVTFALGGLVVAAIMAVFSVRLVQWGRAASPVQRWVVMCASGLAFGSGLAFVARLVGGSAPASAFVLDVVALVFASAFGAGVFPYRSRPVAPLALAGPPLAAILLVVGLGTLHTTPALRSTIADQAPVLAGAMAVSRAVGCGWADPH